MGLSLLLLLPAKVLHPLHLPRLLLPVVLQTQHQPPKPLNQPALLLLLPAKLQHPLLPPAPLKQPLMLPQQLLHNHRPLAQPHLLAALPTAAALPATAQLAELAAAHPVHPQDAQS
jgi:hypothetical protein